MFKKASKEQGKLRLLITGTAGSGKTTAALVIATTMSDKVAFIDTEKGSASLYADVFDFDVLELSEPFEPEKYVAAIKDAEKAGFEVCIVDSISHEWQYCLEMITKIGGSSYTAWAKVTPRHDKLVNAILSSSMHIIACSRSKAEYVLEDKNGKSVPKKVGMQSIQRDGMDYEFTIVFDINQNHLATTSKDRSRLFDGKDFEITPDVADQLTQWLKSGKSVSSKKEPIEKNNTPKNPFEYAENLQDVNKIWSDNKNLQRDILFKESASAAKQKFSMASAN
jgi:hypothetical protein